MVFYVLNDFHLAAMHYKHIQRAPLWQVVIAVIICVCFAKWTPAQTLGADTAVAAVINLFSLLEKLPEMLKVLAG